jgi:flagellar hook protein FlgE
MKRLIKFGVAGTVIHRRNFMPAILLALGSLTLAMSVSATELVENGGFEEPVVPHLKGWTTYYGQNGEGECEANGELECNDGTLVPGWTVFWTDLVLDLQVLEPGRLEIQNNTVIGTPNAKSGEQKAELDSHHRAASDDNNATILQFLPTCPRSAYTLTYAWKSRTEMPHDNDIRVVVRDSIVRTHTRNTDWEEEEFNFVSDSSFETGLAFASIGDSTTKGGFLDDVSVTGKLGGSAEVCDSNNDDPTPICDDGKPQVLTLLYDGNEFSQHNQDSNEVIISDPPVDSDGKALPFPNPALIKVYDHKTKSTEPLNSFTLDWGETFDVKGPHNRIPPRLRFEIIDPDTDEVFQTVQFHTSCSQPLEALDEFGGITVWSAKINEVNKTTPAFDNNL